MKRTISLLFLSIVFLFSLMTLYTSRGAVKYIVENTSRANNNIQDFRENIDKVLKDGFWRKNSIINFYGLAEKIMGRRSSNDRKYYRDSSNIMHIDRGVHDFGSFYKDVNWLSEYCKEKRIPLVINQVPEKGIFGDTYSKLVDSECTTNYIGRLKEIAISNNNIYVNAFDLPGNNNLLDTDIFFKTDFHCTTLAELTEVSEIVRQLQFRGVKFYEPEIVLDFDNPENYEKFNRKFIGNLSSQYGKFYAGTDNFVYYVPKYETDMQRINKEGVVYKSGKFTDSMLNGLSVDSKNWKYFVTDYLNWPEPYLEIYNNLAENAPNILVFIDSQSMRTVTYLSLMCGNVTVLDPRYFNAENNYFEKIRNKAYDAIIIFATCDLYRGLTYESELLNKTTGGVLVCMLFFLCLLLPLLFISLKSADLSVKEKRNLAAFPALRENDSWNKNFCKEFSAWFEDHLGFREEFINIASWTKFTIFNQSPSEKVHIGKDGWYFYTQDYNIDIAQGNYPITEQLLEEILFCHKEIQKRLKEKGIEYVVILPTSKVSIYPEKLRIGKGKVIKTPVDLVADYLEENSDIKVVRLKDCLLAEKNNRQIYYKTDTHWSHAGGYAAYKQILQKFKEWGFVSTEEMPVETSFYESEAMGEFEDMMGIKLPKEKILFFDLKNTRSQVNKGAKTAVLKKILEEEGVWHVDLATYYTNPSSKSKSVMIWGDSMFQPGRLVTETLSENCSELYYIFASNDGPVRERLIDELKPDVLYMNRLNDIQVGFLQESFNT